MDSSQLIESRFMAVAEQYPNIRDPAKRPFASGSGGPCTTWFTISGGGVDVRGDVRRGEKRGCVTNEN